ncbi:MAG: cytochrome c-type biogenesis protein [Methylophilaceae bacterium]
MKSSMIIRLMCGLCIVLFMLQCFSAWAENASLQQSNVAIKSAEVEAKVQRLAEELRCLVCDNQTLADSNAELAQSLRKEIRAMASKGKDDEAIINALVMHHGDFIRYRPPQKITTLLLWFAPTALLLVVGVSLLIWLRRWEKKTSDGTLGLDEACEATILLNKES